MVAIMQSLLVVFLILTHPTLILGTSGPCKDGEIEVGLHHLCTDATDQIDPHCRDTVFISDSGCGDIDTAPDSDTEACDVTDPSDWNEKSKITCDPKGSTSAGPVWNVVLKNGQRYGSLPDNNDAPCKPPSGSSLCSPRSPVEYWSIQWCCPPYTPPAPPAPPPPPPSPSPITAKMMVVGDSISHGADYDWTWRWRLADWLQSNGNKISFVGPFKGTHGPQSAAQVRPNPPLFPGEVQKTLPDIVGLYADQVPGSFTNTQHASYWGRQAVQTRDTIKEWVATYQPDYILILLGFNDLGWLFASPGGLVGVMGDLVGNARQGNPNVKILVGNVVQRSFIGGRQDLVDNTIAYNKLLETALSGWFRYESPIVYVDVAHNYLCSPQGCPEGYDGLHPNGLGEYAIAQSFANTLKDKFSFPGDNMQIGSAPSRPVSSPSSLSAVAVPEGIYLGWAPVANNREYEFRARVKGLEAWWSDGGASSYAIWYTWVFDGQEWEFQVRTKGDTDVFSDWSGLVSAVAHPSTAPGPSHIHVTPGDGSFQVSWDAVPGYNVNRYEVIFWDLDTPGAWTGGYAAAGTSTTVSGLLNGHRYSVWVSTWVNLSGGPAEGVPGGARDVTVGGGKPGAPSGFSATNTDPTTVHLTWSSSGGATGYAIYARSLPSGDLSLSGTTTSLSQDIGWLYPGTWNYEFCVAAYNGDLESDHICTTPPVYPGFRKRGQSDLPVDASNVTFISNTTVNPSATNMAYHQQLQSLWSNVQQSRSAAADANLGSNSTISTR